MIQNQWYLIAFLEEIPPASWKKIRICSKDLLLVKDASGKLSCIEDRCCHRNVHLSLGTFHNDLVTCAYHGWQYNIQGNCVSIPSQQKTKTISKKLCIKQFPLHIQNNLVWIFLGENNPKDSPIILPEMDRLPYVYNKHTFKANLSFVSESLIDPYHIGHVHKKSIGSLLGSIPNQKPDFKIKYIKNGFEGEYMRKNTGNFYEKKYFGETEYIPVRFAFYYPNLSKLDIQFKKRRLVIYEHMTEVEPNVIEMIQITLWDNIFKPFPIFAKWLMNKQSNRIVEEDIDFFKSQYQIQKDQNYSIQDQHVKADEISLFFRKFWKKQKNRNL